MNTLIAISGPTASGKSSLGIQLAKAVGGAIICADSRTVYRELDIGSGKVTTEYPATWRETEYGPVAMVEGVDHYGLNLVGLNEVYTAARFQEYAQRLLGQLWLGGIQPIIVGGTGLYISALTEGYVFGGRYSQAKRDPGFKSRVFVVDPGREMLYRKIDERVDTRMQQGMLQEVRELVRQGWSERLLGLGLEYRVLTQYLLGNVDNDKQLADTVSRLKGQIHAYARRQYTWWRHRSNAKWISEYTELEREAM